uniref:Uncharacterized protein n=1 Tax=Sphaerodactylus townsendi TaxID=933632 RepID=A0ACB8G7V2_9SAUR
MEVGASDISTTITECYQFKFKYTDKGPEMDFVSKHHGDNSSITCADTKKASILLLRKIYVLMQNLGPLPDNVCLTMKLFYYDEVTPSDYQPPGFKEGDCEEMVFEGEPVYLNMGEVPTPFHTLKVKMTTEKDRMEHVDRAILKSSDLLVPPKAQRFDGPALKTDVERLVNSTSQLEVSEGRTRSGRIFQRNEGDLENSKNQLAAKCPEEMQKRRSLGSGWPGGLENSKNQLAAKCPKEIQKKRSLGSVKPVYHFELSSSQDSGPKRRRFSEPKEQF